MADDTRKYTDDGVPITKEALTLDPNRQSFTGSQWDEVRKPKPPQSANLLAGGTENTAGGKIPEVSISNAFQDGLTWGDFTDLPDRPCVRDSYLTGLGAGFAAGGARAIWGASIASASNYAVFAIFLSSGVMYQWCQYRRQAERDGMMRAVQVLDRKQAEKKAREEARERQKEERRKLKELELDAHYAKLREAEAAKKPWWKVW